MSKSTRSPHQHTAKSRKRATVATPDARTRPPRHPRVSDGIDYGPALAAAQDLVEWAFDLAARDVADSSEGRRRVRTARRFVLARLHGKRTGGVPVDDVLFTAGLLARIFEADLHLPMTDMVTILGRIGFSSEVVPLWPHASSTACRPQDPPITPITPRPAAVASWPAPAAACNGCGQLGAFFRRAA